MKSGIGASGMTFFGLPNAFEHSEHNNAARISSFFMMKISGWKKYRLVTLCGNSEMRGSLHCASLRSG